MSALGVVLVITGILFLCALTGGLAVIASRGAATSRGVRMHATGPESFRFTTPVGRASARIVLHEDMGRVYEVRTEFRGQGSHIGYVPPANALLRSHVERLVTEAQTVRRLG